MVEEYRQYIPINKMTRKELSEQRVGEQNRGTEKRIEKFRLKTNIKEKKTETEHREKQRNR